MTIRELCKLCSRYEHLNVLISLRTADLGFYTQKWKNDELIQEIMDLKKEQEEIRIIIAQIADVEF